MHVNKKMETVKKNGQPKSVRNALKRSANPRSARKCAVVLVAKTKMQRNAKKSMPKNARRTM